MTRPRVLHVVTRYTGGSMRRLLDVVDAVDADHLVAMGPGSEQGRLRELDGRAVVVDVPHLVREVSPVGDARALVELVRLVRRHRPDVVHTHQSKAGLLGRVAARVGGVRVVDHSASMASFGPGYGRTESTVFRVAELLTAPLVTRYFVVGRDLSRRLEKGARISSRKLVVVRSYVDAQTFTPGGRVERAGARAGFGLDPDAPVVAYIGSLEPRKHVVDLPAMVGAAAAVVGRDRDVTLLVAGDGPQRTALADRRVPGVDIVMLGQVDAVADVIRAADVVALPSSAEGVPQVLVQAAMVGVPFVAYDVDGVNELIDLGSPGVAVPLGDRPAFAHALAEALIADRTDPEPDASDRRRWQEWDREFIADEYRRWYESDLTR